MTQTIDAIFQQGVLKPVHELNGIAENQRVRVTIDAPAGQKAPFADWVGGMPDHEAKEMMEVIDEEFGKVNADDWR